MGYKLPVIEKRKCRKGTLVCVIQYKSFWYIFLPAYVITETGKGSVLSKRQIHQLKIRIRYIRCLKSLITHILWVREESHFLFRGQDHKPLFPFRFTVAGTSIQQKVRVSMPLELLGYPQAVDVYNPPPRWDAYSAGIYSIKHFPRTLPFKNTSPSSSLSFSQFFLDMI